MLAACTSSTTVDRSTRYEQLIDGFDTLEACRAYPNRSFNCVRALTVCENGGFELIVTDVVNSGRYSRDGDRITGTREGYGDSPETFSLTLNDDSFESVELGGMHAWTSTDVDVSTVCDSLEHRPWW